MYDGAMTSVRTTCGETSEFSMTIDLYQGSSLNPYLFTLIMGKFIAHIQEEALWCMLLVDDMVLVGESRGGVSVKLVILPFICLYKKTFRSLLMLLH